MNLCVLTRYFYPRSPCGERRMQPSRPSRTTPFLSTLSLRRATLMWWQSNTTIKISIHALLAESDVKRHIRVQIAASISIHALLAESDARAWTCTRSASRFLSTLSLRRATLQTCQAENQSPFLSTLSLRRATARAWTCTRSASRFLSTLSLRRATRCITIYTRH